MAEVGLVGTDPLNLEYTCLDLGNRDLLEWYTREISSIHGAVCKRDANGRRRRGIGKLAEVEEERLQCRLLTSHY